MKKALVLLFLSLATLSSPAQMLNISGYRLDDNGIQDNDGRIVVTNLNNEVKTDYIKLDNNRLQSNAWFTASVPAGQKVVKWLAYSSSPASHNPPAQTNQFAGAETEYVWRYNTKDTADKYIVVDYDYIDYTLTYNANGGSGSMSSTTQCYTNAFNLTGNAFTKTGYTFDGWTNKTITAALADQSSVSGAVFGVTYTNKTATLYAKWKPNSYAVRFNKNADDAKGSMSDQPFTYDVAQNLSSNGFSRAGYVFGGWTNATGTAYADGDSVSNLATEEGEVVNLFAKWTHVWTVTFKEADQFGGETISSATYEDGSTVTPPADPQHEGWRFDGWGGDFSTTATKDATYEARYTAKTYALTYHANYGEDTFFSTSFSYGTTVNIPKTMQGITSRTGYTMQGWAFSPDAAEIAYEPGETGVMFTTAGSVDLYAVWAPIEYTIAFDGNGGEGTMSAMLGVKYDVVTNLTPNAFTKTGVEFKHWLFGSAVYENCAPVSNLTATAGATVTMTAVWSEKCYVAYDGNGGDGEMETQTFDAETLPQSLTSNAFTKVGYTFGGWATNSTEAANLMARYEDGTEFTTFASLPAAAGETATLYAVWQTNTYTVVFNPNCTSYTGMMANQLFVYDQAQALTVNGFTNETGLAFAGWTNYTDNVGYADGVTVSNLTDEANGTVTLHALWDVGELSKAMHCDNLYWENQPNATNNTWLAKYEEGIGYGTDSCVVTNGAQISYMIAGVTTNGVLSFKWKANHKHEESDKDDKDGLKVGYYTDRNEMVATFADLGTLARSEAEAQNETWLAAEVKIEQAYFEHKSKIWLVLRSRRQSCYIDQMTWTPAGSTVEPTEENKPTISAFTATAGGFRLTADNVSASFSYQILATNELVSGDWPVMTNLTYDAIGSGFPITPKAGEPTMFYKVKVIAK